MTTTAYAIWHVHCIAGSIKMNPKEWRQSQIKVPIPFSILDSCPSNIYNHLSVAQKTKHLSAKSHTFFDHHNVFSYFRHSKFKLNEMNVSIAYIINRCWIYITYGMHTIYIINQYIYKKNNIGLVSICIINEHWA